MRGVNVFVHRDFPMATWRGIDDHQDTHSVWETPGLFILFISASESSTYSSSHKMNGVQCALRLGVYPSSICACITFSLFPLILITTLGGGHLWQQSKRHKRWYTIEWGQTRRFVFSFKFSPCSDRKVAMYPEELQEVQLKPDSFTFHPSFLHSNKVFSWKLKLHSVGSQIRTGVNRRNTVNTVYMYIWTKPAIKPIYITGFHQFQSDLPHRLYGMSIISCRPFVWHTLIQIPSVPVWSMQSFI